MSKRKTKGGPNEVDVHVGQRLRVKRSLLGMSQEKLADAIGLTFQQVQKYERGTNRISASRLYELSNVLGVPVSYFFDQFQGGIQGQGNDNYAPQGLADNEQDSFHDDSDLMSKKETLDLVRAYYSLKDPEARKDILKFVKSMVERL